MELVQEHTSGGLDLEGQKGLESVFNAVAKSIGKQKADVVQRIKGRISIDLCRAQSRALHRRRTAIHQSCEMPPEVSRAVAEVALESPPEMG